MKVKELIHQLRQCNPSAEVFVLDKDGVGRDVNVLESHKIILMGPLEYCQAAINRDRMKVVSSEDND